MRICILTSSFPKNKNDLTSAAGVFVYDYANEFAQRGHQVFVFTQNVKGEEDNDSNITIRRFKWLGGEKPMVKMNFFNPIDCIKLISYFINGNKEVIKFVKENKIDICHAMWAVPSGVFAFRIKKEMGIPYIVTSLGSDINRISKIPVLKSILRKVLINADGIFSNSACLKEKIEIFSGKKCGYIPTARKTTFKKDMEINIQKDKTNFLYVGRFERVKGIDILIEAVRYLKENQDEFILHLVGSGHLKGYVDKKIKEYKLEKNVFMVGAVSMDKLFSYYNQSDCVIIPSRSESMPLVYSESMEMGVPVIVSDVGDMGLITHKYNTGKVVPPENPEALYKSLKEFIEEDKEIYKENIQSIRKMFSINGIVEEYEKQLANVIANNS